MPSDLVKGRCTLKGKALLNVAHRALTAAFDLPKDMRHEVVDEHQNFQLAVEDVTLGIAYSDQSILVEVMAPARPRKAGQIFHQLLCEGFAKECGIAPSDVIVATVAKTDGILPLGHGRTQFLTGRLQLTSSSAGRARQRSVPRWRGAHRAVANAA